MEAGEFISVEARRLGFTAVGFARAGPLVPEAGRLRIWLERGYAGAMAWMKRGVVTKSDPAAAFAARSVVVVAMPYGADQADPAPGFGRVARYARGRDYHNLIRRRLRKLARAVDRRYPGARSRVFVDTGPVLERAWAQRAGLGWQGKHTVLILGEQGSYHFLGVLFTALDLAPSPPAADLCGSCRLCLEACPTAAFPEEYVLDARRCLSYLTIEERGSIPLELRDLYGDHLYGCDVCQEVCPYNRRPAELLEPALAAGSEHESLAEILALDDAGFAARYAGRVLLRPHREGLARNAALVAGATRNQELRAALVRAAADDPSPLVREHAVWALARLDGA